MGRLWWWWYVGEVVAGEQRRRWRRRLRRATYGYRLGVAVVWTLARSAFARRSTR